MDRLSKGPWRGESLHVHGTGIRGYAVVCTVVVLCGISPG